MRRVCNFVLVATVAMMIFPSLGWGASVAELQAKIADHNEEIERLEKQIVQYKKSLETAGAERDSLERALKIVETNRQKLVTDIKVTEKKIATTSLKLEELGTEIGRKEAAIKERQLAIGETVRLLQREADEHWLEALLASPTLANFWRRQTALTQYVDRVEENRRELENLRSSLEDDKNRTADEKKKLAVLKEDLSDEKYLADREKQSKERLITETGNKEANYKKLLDQTLARKEAFERELFAFESELKIAIDPSLLPALGTKPLLWPLDEVFITQSFGITADSRRLYTSGSHNGVDFRAAVGTPIKAAASGRVVAVGDTDTVCRKASYGKWVLLEHTNGLSTLYAHLSLIKVAPGQQVMVGEPIAYSGNTGYATGPHLHLTVYATQGVKVASRQSTVCAGTYTIPLADPKAYLNPMDYL